MAKMSIKMPDDLLMKLSRLGDRTDMIVPKVLDEGAQVVLRKTKANLTAQIGRNLKHPSRSTGTLVNDLGVSSARLDRNGDHNVKIGFRERRRNKASNAMIANILEYGKSGQPAKPFLKPAVTSTKSAVIDAMRKAFDKEVKRL